MLTHSKQVNADRSRRFAHKIHRAELEGAHRRFVQVCGIGSTDDDHRKRHFTHDSPECGESVHPRHRNVERDNVRRERSYLLQCLDTVSSSPYDAIIIAELNDLGDESAHESAIIDYQHTL